jgi:hypothetical protein
MPDTSKPDKNDIADNSADFEFEPLAEPQPERSAPNFTRRIQVLMAAIIVATIAYTGAWFWFGSQLVKGTETAISDAAIKGQIIICEQPTAKGYPFRMGLTCAKTSFADPVQNVKLEAGAFRSAAQVYQPRHVIGELDGPLSITANNLIPMTVNWALAHASFSGSGGLPSRVSVEIEKPVVSETKAPTQLIGSANLAGFHMRQGENNQIDLASTIDAALFKDAPAFNFSSDASISGATRFEAALNSGKPLVDVLRGNQGEIRDVNLTFITGGSLSISGPFSLSEAGLISGTFSVKASQAGALIDNLSKVGIALGAAANNLTAIKAMAINDRFNLSITVKDGNAALGFIPLGKIPAF